MWGRFIVIVVVAVTTAAAAAGRGQALADRVPGDALVYVGCTGVDAQADACKGSHLQNVLDHSDIPAFVNEFLPQVLVKAGVDAPTRGATGVAGKRIPHWAD